ncbi:Hypothetical protein ORPV_1030 [Orpheovirus IHUMI-LCC2]|uniref:Uncharacterized protein n=1 Tax=Orpheovirus IHUMI-LCC2 TaxID=2023057 RepID=A0A2I2L5X2_9VIRU|nr:Hypothetical protein ORPV_1030 [Orpheovirus IHUMI-LCC2]SNW62934.1 Hypothetical protein ORPV_1030 [Orpheovirus IHUMI-LCC2]
MEVAPRYNELIKLGLKIATTEPVNEDIKKCILQFQNAIPETNIGKLSVFAEQWYKRHRNDLLVTPVDEEERILDDWLKNGGTNVYIQYADGVLPERHLKKERHRSIRLPLGEIYQQAIVKSQTNESIKNIPDRILFNLYKLASILEEDPVVKSKLDDHATYFVGSRTPESNFSDPRAMMGSMMESFKGILENAKNLKQDEKSNPLEALQTITKGNPFGEMISGFINGMGLKNEDMNDPDALLNKFQNVLSNVSEGDSTLTNPVKSFLEKNE